MKFRVLVEMEAMRPDLTADGWLSLQTLVERLERDGRKWVVVKA